ncbi:tyrosine-type recombinase/integrase [Micromonospora sp. NPDC047620]|uniref:tyrosine-type recombinase/integrase n=1 Tax=Micromonospora sp. NPDC047620 TaxID=3364251 RepID=UPI0037195F98
MSSRAVNCGPVPLLLHRPILALGLRRWAHRQFGRCLDSRRGLLGSGPPPGPPRHLVVYGRTNVAMDRHTLNRDYWHPALTAAGIQSSRATGMHALRHFYASVLLDAGESVKALSEYLGHADPGFTLRTYTHLMPTSEDRTRRARCLGCPRTAWRRPSGDHGGVLAGSGRYPSSSRTTGKPQPPWLIIRSSTCCSLGGRRCRRSSFGISV